MLNPTVIVASFYATAKLLSSIGLGAILTPAGPAIFGRVLDKAAVSSLSKLTYWLFQPCFLFCGVAETLSKAATTTSGDGLSRSSLLLMSYASMIQILLGSIIGKVITTKQLRKQLLGIDPKDDETAKNIKMCTAFANSGPLPFILSEALFGKSPAILTDVSACVSFYLLMWSPLFWTFGKTVLGTDSLSSSSTNGGVVKQLKSFISPPVMGSILGVIVGSNAFLRKLMLTSKGILAPLHGAMSTFGSAYLPAAILVLAGSLVTKAKTSSNNDRNDDSSQTSSSSLHPKTIMTLLVSRFLLSPLMAISVVRLLSWTNLLPMQNPRTLAILTFTLLMEGCMPPAQNSVIILQLDGKTERAAKMAKILTVMYSFSALPVTLLLGWCLNASGILNF